jgi:hypothetical protein
MLVLYHDYDHLSPRAARPTRSGSCPPTALHMWDETAAPKQPFMLRYENGNLYDEKIAVWMDPNVRRRTSIWQSPVDSTRFVTQFEPDLWNYWRGRTSTSANLSWWQPVARGYGFFPFILEPGEPPVRRGRGRGLRGRQRGRPRLHRPRRERPRRGGRRCLFNPVATWYHRSSTPTSGRRNFIGSDVPPGQPAPLVRHIRMWSRSRRGRPGHPDVHRSAAREARHTAVRSAERAGLAGGTTRFRFPCLRRRSASRTPARPPT